MAFETSVFAMMRDRSIRDFRPVFYAVVEGHRYIWTQPGITALPLTGFAPTGWTYSDCKPLLKIGHGLDPIREEASRKAGVATTGEITISLGPDEDDYLLGLFAEQHSSLITGVLAATFDWTDTELVLADSTSFPASGEFGIGKEWCSYSGNAANTLTGITRGLYGSVCNRYGVGDNLYTSSIIVKNRITTWEGRICRLFMAAADSEGNILAEVQPQEIFAGKIASHPEADDYVVWSFRVRDLTSMLDTEIGGYKVEGTLPTKKMFNWYKMAEQAESPKDGKEGKTGWVRGGWVVPGQNDYLEFRLTVDAELDDASIIAYDSGYIEVILDPGWHPDLAASVADQITTAIAANPVDVDVVTTCNLITEPPATETLDESAYYWRVWLTMESVSGFKAATPQTWSLHINSLHPASVWSFLGFQDGGPRGPIDDIFEGVPRTSWAARAHTATRMPSFFRFDGNSQLCMTQMSPDQFPQLDKVVPSTGLLSIGGTEVASFTAAAADSTVPIPNGYKFTLGTRAMMGSTTYVYELRWEYGEDGPELTESGDPSVKVMWGSATNNVFDLLLKLMITTGGNRYTAGDYAEWDTTDFPEVFGCPIPGPYIDTESFDAWAATLAYTIIFRQLAFTEPMNLREVIDSQLMPLGLSLLPRPLPDGSYKLSIVETKNLVNQPGLDIIKNSTYDYAIVASSPGSKVYPAGVEVNDRPRKSHDLNDIINRAVVRPLYDVAKEEQLEWTWIYTQEDSRTEYDTLHSLSIDVKGIGTNPSAGQWFVIDTIAPLIQRFSRRIGQFTFYCGREGWTFSPGDHISVSLPGIPNGTGTRGLSNQTMTILRVEKSYFAPSRYPCEITAVVGLDWNCATYAPSAKVTGKTGAGPTVLTLAANTFTPANVAKTPFPEVAPADYADILFFLGAGAIKLWRKGRDDSAETLTVTLVDPKNNQITVAEAVTNDCSLNDAYITFADWNAASLTAVQKWFSYIGPLYSPTADPFYWQ